MNPGRSKRNIKNKCSCDECLYKPKRTLQEIGRNGSKIDKLFNDKYLPLRERKLLEKLVRTRGVYDDIRNRILSLSNVEIAKDSNSEENYTKRDEETSSTILKLVNFVDRGEYSSVHSPIHLHSDCCRCCDCNSKLFKPKYHNVHMHIPSQEHIDKYLESKRKEHTHKEINKAVRFRSVRSEPCLCTLKFREPNYNPKKNIKNDNTIDSLQKKGLEKKNKPASSLINLQNCECKLSDIMPSISKKSVTRLKNNLKDSIRASVSKIENVFRIKKDSIMIFRDKMKRKQALKLWTCEADFCIPNECVPEKCYEEIKRRKEIKLLKNQLINKYDGPNMHNTQQARKEISLHISRPRSERKNNHNLQTKKNKKTQKKFASKQTLKSTPDKEIHFPRECIPLMCIPGECDPKVCAKTLQTSPMEYKLKRCFCTQKLQSPKSVKHNNADITLPQKAEKNAKKLVKHKNAGSTLPQKTEKNTKVYNKVICKCEQKESISISSQTNNIKPTEKTLRKSYLSMKERKLNKLLPYECEPLFCIPDHCDPAVCEKRIRTRNLRKNKNSTRGSGTDIYQNKATRTITSKSATLYTATKGQVPKLNKRKKKDADDAASHKFQNAGKSKSSPSAPATHRQAVRISSSFRFDIEFFKDAPKDNSENDLAEKHLQHNRNYVKPVKNKANKTSGLLSPELVSGESKPDVKEKMVQKERRKKTKHTITNSLKRCLCTLKLQNERNHNINKTISKKTMTSDVQIKEAKMHKDISREYKRASTQTKKHSTVTIAYVRPPAVKRPSLLPYECEPHFCIPGECDPLVCDERIRVRNTKYKEKAPLLKRCFCTLRFHNDNNANRNREVIPLDSEDVNVKSTGTETNKKMHIIHKNKGNLNKLLPYECEPGVCVPDYCDPLECKRLLRDRKRQEATYLNKDVNTKNPVKKSVFSGTKYINKTQKTQSNGPPSRSKLQKKYDQVSDKLNISEVNNSSEEEAISRQSVTIGSRFSFNIEFSKQKAAHNMSVDNKNMKQKPKNGIKLTKGKGTSHRLRKRNVSLASILPRVVERSTISPKLKRCFCTLKLGAPNLRKP